MDIAPSAFGSVVGIEGSNGKGEESSKKSNMKYGPGIQSFRRNSVAVSNSHDVALAMENLDDPLRQPQSGAPSEDLELAKKSSQDDDGSLAADDTFLEALNGAYDKWDWLWISPRVQAYQNMAVFISAIVNIIIFPAQLGISGPIYIDKEPWWWATYMILDVVLWSDILCKFITPVTHRAERIFSHKFVARQYLRDGIDGLVPDMLIRLPWDLLMGDLHSISYGHLTCLLLIRKAHKRLTALIAGNSMIDGGVRFMSPASRLVVLCGMSLIFVHWYSCLLFLIGRLNPEDSWLSLYAPGSPLPLPEGPWYDWPHWAQYARAFDRAMLIFIGEGAHGETHIEVLYSCFGLLMGTVFLAYFTSTMVTLVTLLNQAEEAARMKVVQVKDFLNSSQLPPDLCRRVDDHLHAVLVSRKIQLDTTEILGELSEPLIAEVALHRCQELLKSPTFLALLVGDGGILDPHFVKLLVLRLHLAVFSPSDCITEEGDTGDSLFFLSAGTVCVYVNKVQVTMLSRGACFGEIAMLVPGTRRKATIVAQTFTETQRLSRKDFLECISEFPSLKNRMENLVQKRLGELDKHKQLAERRTQKEVEMAEKEAGKRAGEGSANSSPFAARGGFAEVIRQAQENERATAWDKLRQNSFASSLRAQAAVVPEASSRRRSTVSEHEAGIAAIAAMALAAGRHKNQKGGRVCQRSSLLTRLKAADSGGGTGGSPSSERSGSLAGGHLSLGGGSSPSPSRATGSTSPAGEKPAGQGGWATLRALTIAAREANSADSSPCSSRSDVQGSPGPAGWSTLRAVRDAARKNRGLPVDDKPVPPPPPETRGWGGLRRLRAATSKQNAAQVAPAPSCPSWEDPASRPGTASKSSRPTSEQAPRPMSAAAAPSYSTTQIEEACLDTTACVDT